MEVIKQGDVPSAEDWTIDVVCKKERATKGARGTNPGGGCKAVLKITVKDLVLMSWHGTHFPHYYSAFRCPNCGKYTEVTRVPIPIWKNLYATKEAIPDGFDDSV